MGSKLAILAAQLIGARLAWADASASQLQKDGLDAYKAGKYDTAVVLLHRAFELDPKPNTLFALAQAERLSGDCKSALDHYRALLAKTTEANQATMIRASIKLCDGKGTDPEPKLVEPPAPPKPVEVAPVPTPAQPPQLVVREISHTDPVQIMLVAGGALGLGVGAGLFLLSSAARDDAASASTFDGYTTLNDKADRDRKLAFVAGGVGVALLGVAVYRWVSAKPHAAEVVAAPSAGGGTVLVVGSF